MLVATTKEEVPLVVLEEVKIRPPMGVKRTVSLRTSLAKAATSSAFIVPIVS
jgi:hypothetical protein